MLTMTSLTSWDHFHEPLRLPLLGIGTDLPCDRHDAPCHADTKIPRIHRGIPRQFIQGITLDIAIGSTCHFLSAYL